MLDPKTPPRQLPPTYNPDTQLATPNEVAIADKIAAKV